MRTLVAFGRGVWDFIVGDDWLTACGVVVALGLTALISERYSSDWWVMPIAVGLLLALSIRRAASSAGAPGKGPSGEDDLAAGG